MTTINDLKSLKAHAAALDNDLRAVFAKYGMTMERRSAKIGMGKFDIKVTCAYGSAEEQTALASHEYDMYAPMLGLPVGGFGKTYRFPDGRHYKVVGVQPSKPKNCVKLTRVPDGKGFQCPAAAIRESREVK